MSNATYLNMEVLAIQAAKEAINQMHEDLYISGLVGFYDQQKVFDNIKLVLTASTMLTVLMESYLNHILEGILKIDDDTILKENILPKIKRIYKTYNISKKITKTSNWDTFGKLKELRNELVHFKSRYIGSSTGFPYTKIHGLDLMKVLTKAEMINIMSKIIKLTEIIAADLGLAINKDSAIVNCPARGAEGDIPTYVYDPRHPYHDLD